MAAGVLIGVSVTLALMAGVSLPGVSWLIAVGMAKLVYIASAGFLGAGAIVQRLAKRDDEARALAAARDDRALAAGSMPDGTRDNSQPS